MKLFNQCLEPVLLKLRQDQGRKWLKGKILDYGCGEAKLLENLPKNCEYVGLDANKKLVHKLNLTHRQVFLTPSQLIEWNCFNNYFDTVVMYSVFEHFPDEQSVLQSIKRVIKPRGNLIIITVTPSAELFLTILARIGLIKTEWMAEHAAYYTQRGLKESLKLAGFRVKHFNYFEFGLNQLIIAKKQTNSFKTKDGLVT